MRGVEASQVASAPSLARTRVSSPVALCCANLAAIVFLQRLVLPLGGQLSVSCLLPIALLSAAYFFWARLAVLNGATLFSYTAFVMVAFMSQILGGMGFSVTSFALMMAIYVIFPIRVSVSISDYRYILRFYQSCMTIVAFMVLGQYAFQLLGFGIPILENFVPEQIIVKNFVYLQEIVWESGLYKPNGVVMLEASFLSQFIALALIIEFWVFRRMTMVILFGGVLVLTFSGTGMILAAITLILMVVRRGVDRGALVLAGAVVCVALGLLATGFLEAISGRVTEFSDRDASASVRFVAPFSRLYETLSDGDLRALFWGSGAGFIDKEIGFAWSPPVKVWVEYGLIAFGFYWVFLATLVRSAPMPILAFAFGLEYLVFGGGALLQPPVVFACFFLGIGYTLTNSRPGFNTSLQGSRFQTLSELEYARSGKPSAGY